MHREPLTREELDRLALVAPRCPVCAHQAIISHTDDDERRWTCPSTDELALMQESMSMAEEVWVAHLTEDAEDDADEDAALWSAPVSGWAWLYISGAPMFPGFAPQPQEATPS